jgi:3-phosphoshikimate 1-carboxyvinyltransferase
MLGVLAGQPFSTTLRAGKSLSMRPMKRVAEPLRMMGAKIETRHKRQGPRLEEYPPITIRGGNLKAITYRLPVASAQVKSAILLAGLYAKGITKVIEPIKTRDHTEKMLRLFKADLKIGDRIISIKGNTQLKTPNSIELPGDISAASFFIVAACLIKNSNLIIRSLGLNPTRCGLIKVLKRMGAKIKIKAKKPSGKNWEPVGDLKISSSQLKGTVVKKQEIPSLIDELPILMVAAALTKGKTRIESVQELRVKETDRISSMIKGLTKMGARIRLSKKNRQEDIIITGVKQLKGAKLRSFADHRTAMSLIIASLTARSDGLIDDVSCVSKSFPNFLQILHKLTC